MNFMSQESPQKLRGGYYTHPDIAAFLARWISHKDTARVLEPSCGDGAFIRALEEQGLTALRDITAVEIDPCEAEKARQRTGLPLQIVVGDFLRWYLSHPEHRCSYDAVLGNPPFIRYQYLSNQQQLLAEQIFSQAGLSFTRHTNAWVTFVISSIDLLRPGGRIGMVIPSELLHIPHAGSLRQHLLMRCSKVLIIDIQDLLFGDALQGTMLLMAQKRAERSYKTGQVSVLSSQRRDILLQDPDVLFATAPYIKRATTPEKWMDVLLTPVERRLVDGLRSDATHIRAFKDVASVDVGIVTGANKFFLVSKSVLDQYSLHEYAHPMFGRSDHAKGLVFTTLDHQENTRQGLPSHFLHFPSDSISELPWNLQEYLRSGIAQNLHIRFKCRTRKCWYRVPSVYASPVAMLKRCHSFPRLVLNMAHAYTTDTAYRIEPYSVNPAGFVLGFINSMTSLCAELEGRHYGGGVLELVPSEIERLLVPTIDATMDELYSADCDYRRGSNAGDFLMQNDLRVLGRIGICKSDQGILYSAWQRLCRRRHRSHCLE